MAIGVLSRNSRSHSERRAALPAEGKFVLTASAGLLASGSSSDPPSRLRSGHWVFVTLTVAGQRRILTGFPYTECRGN